MSATTTAWPTVELVAFEPASPRSHGLFKAFASSAQALGITMDTRDRYRGGADWMMCWGPGAPNRWPAMQAQIAQGGHVLCWDLAYWSRESKLRVSIDAPHPQRWVMARDWPSSRVAADRVATGTLFDADGPVVIAGIGEKATVQYGPQVRAWETSMAASAESRGKRVIYRPKRSTGTIESALSGASLLVTWHSNAAVDALRYGVPVICRDGAAAAVCPSDWPAFGDPRPLDPATRDRFLANLAWFQWAPAEASACWIFLRELLT